MLTVGLALAVLGTIGILLRLVRRIRPAAVPRWRILIVQAAVVALWILGGNGLASLRERRAEAAWTAVDAKAAARATAASAASNPAALELLKRAASLGLPVGKPGSADAGAKDPADEAALARLGPYLDRVLQQADDRLEAAPTELRAWLVVEDANARAVERQLLEGGAIDWGPPLAGDSLPYSPLELLKLDAVLTAGALDRMKAGDAAGASSALEAASALAASLRDRPETTSRLLAVALDRRLLGALRLAEPVAPGWERRLDEIEDHARPTGARPGESLELLAQVRKPYTTLRGLILETDVAPLVRESRQPASRQLFLALSGGAVPVEGLADAVAAERRRTETPFYVYAQGPLELPYMRLVAADSASVEAQTAAQVAAGDSCGPRPIAPQAHLASWSPLEQADEPLLPRLARTAAMLRAELELTRLVVRARTLRAQSPQREWPSELPGSDASRACPGRRFVSKLLAGRAEIRLEPVPFGEKDAVTSFRMGDGR